jgi:hypothetical protein
VEKLEKDLKVQREKEEEESRRQEVERRQRIEAEFLEQEKKERQRLEAQHAGIFLIIYLFPFLLFWDLTISTKLLKFCHNACLQFIDPVT